MTDTPERHKEPQPRTGTPPQQAAQPQQGTPRQQDAQSQSPRRYLTPECRVGRTDPDFRHGCPACPAPGYRHPVLGWTPVPCGCACHTEEKPS